MQYFRSNSLCLLILFALLGCSTVVTHPSQAKKLEVNNRDMTAAPYLIGAGDELEIKFLQLRN